MKNIFSKTLLPGMLLMIGATGCTGDLDITPDGRLTIEEVFSNPDYNEAYFSSAYDDVPRKHINYFWFDNLPSALSDDSWSCDDVEGVGAINAYKGQGSAENNLFEHYYMDGFDCNYWEKYWRCIRNINVFLRHAEDGTGAFKSESRKTELVSEAHVLRAFYYLQLVKWYGRIPIIVDEPDIASDFSEYRREPAWKVLRFIVEDCEYALNNPNNGMMWRLSNVTERRRFTLGTACAIMSQAAVYYASPLYRELPLYPGDVSDQEDLPSKAEMWEYAYARTKRAYDTLKEHDFELYTSHLDEHYLCSYDELFAGAPDYPACKEIIMSDITNNQPSYWVWGMPIQSNYRAGDVPIQELVDAFDVLSTGKPVLDREQPYLDEQHLQPNYYPNSGYNPSQPFKDRDLRFDAICIHNGSAVYVGDVRSTVATYDGGNCEIKDNARTSTRTGYYNNKFRNWQSCASKRLDDGHWVYYRMAEIYLNLAEAAIETNRISEGMQLVNAIRHRAGFAPEVDLVASSQDEARLMMRKERRVEFVFEEHRFFDVRRWTKYNENLENEKFATGMRPIRKGLKYDYERFLINSDGTTPSKLSYEAKWHFLPIPLNESKTLQEKSGLPTGYWQNYGW